MMGFAALNPSYGPEAPSAGENSRTVPVTRIGATGGNALLLPGERPMPVKMLSERFESWLPGYMAGEP
jgi:phosphoribosylformylglycinamidine synthase